MGSARHSRSDGSTDGRRLTRAPLRPSASSNLRPTAPHLGRVNVRLWRTVDFGPRFAFRSKFDDLGWRASPLPDRAKRAQGGHFLPLQERPAWRQIPRPSCQTQSPKGAIQDGRPKFGGLQIGDEVGVEVIDGHLPPCRHQLRLVAPTRRGGGRWGSREGPRGSHFLNITGVERPHSLQAFCFYAQPREINPNRPVRLVTMRSAYWAIKLDISLRTSICGSCALTGSTIARIFPGTLAFGAWPPPPSTIWLEQHCSARDLSVRSPSNVRFSA